MTRVLVIGGGSIGKRHIKNLVASGIQEIYCLRRAADASFESETGAKVITSYEEADKLGITAVFICSPTSLHNDGLAFAARHQAAIFMEKPLIDSDQGLLQAQNILESHHAVFFIGFMLRFHPLVKQIKEIIEREELGKVYHARFEFGSFLPYWHPWEDYKTGYAARKELGGGVINTITHELDLVQYFFGTPISVMCQKANLNKLEIEVEEICEAVFSYPDKLVSLHLDYLQKDYDRNIKILCDEGKITWNWHENKISIQKHKSDPVALENKIGFEVPQLYVDELSHFFSLVEINQQKHGLDKEHAFENTLIMLKMHESAELGKVVYIND